MTAEKASHRTVPIAWEALEDAFENNAPEVHSYLNVETGDVIRIVDGVAEPATHARIASDPGYMRIDPVSSREQYRWMERFIATVDESELRQKLVMSIDGKGAFRRFKDVLMTYPIDRERWFAFRSERLRIAIEAWLDAHGLKAQERPAWPVPTAEQVRPVVEAVERVQPTVVRRTRAEVAEAARARLRELCDAIPVRELDLALEFLEFLRERRPLPRSRVRGAGATSDDASDDDKDAES
jgi:hypothetical protein